MDMTLDIFHKQSLQNPSQGKRDNTLISQSYSIKKKKFTTSQTRYVSCSSSCYQLLLLSKSQFVFLMAVDTGGH